MKFRNHNLCRRQLKFHRFRNGHQLQKICRKLTIQDHYKGLKATFNNLSKYEFIIWMKLSTIHPRHAWTPCQKFLQWLKKRHTCNARSRFDLMNHLRKTQFLLRPSTYLRNKSKENKIGLYLFLDKEFNVNMKDWANRDLVPGWGSWEYQGGGRVRWRPQLQCRRRGHGRRTCGPSEGPPWSDQLLSDKLR